MADAGFTREEAYQKLVERSMKDEAFRRKLIADPRAAIAEEIGVTIPANVKIQVHEEAADTLHLVVPPPVKASGELSDAELESVAGGVWAWESKTWCKMASFQLIQC